MSTITTTQLPTGTWTLDKTHSTAGFSVKHMVVATYRGSFSEVDGSIRDGVLEGIVRVDSIDAKDENLKGHLLSAEFFDAENTPELRFVSTDVREENGELVVEGDLTIKGITRRVAGRGAVSQPHEDFTGTTKLGVELQAVVDRTEFDLDWNAPLPKGGFALGNEVTITVQLEFALEA